MSFIGIFAKKKEAEQIKEKIENVNKEIKIVPINSNSLENIRNIKFDIIVITNELKKLKEKEKYIEEILNKSKYLILNTDINSDINFLKEVNVRNGDEK